MKFLFAFFALFSIVYASKMDDLDDSCDNGNAKACIDLSYMCEEGRGEAYKNKYKALNLYKKACDKGDATLVID